MAGFDVTDPNSPVDQRENTNVQTSQGLQGEAVPPTTLVEWWMSTAHGEVKPLIAKMEEYGGNGRAQDLIEIGRALVLAGVEMPAVTDDPNGSFDDGMCDAELMELGIYFYLVGKFARWTAAVSEGRLVSDDTLHDIGIYVRMVQRIREVGGWPE